MSSESESVSPPLTVEKCSLVLVDVAGTTTSIDFVKDTLFPFVTERAEAFLSAKWDEAAVLECVAQLREGDQELDAVAAAERVKTLTKENSPNEGLKTLQGLIYKEGYEKGDLKAHVFDDVAEAFETWAKNRKIAVYSTGSVDAQKLLFAHTVAGDLSVHIANYFDQTVGAKTESDSYKKIAEETKTPLEEIVFVTDDVKEATAAKSAGIHAVLVKREGNSDLSEAAVKEFNIITSFAELALDNASKRKIVEEPVHVEAPPSKVAKTDGDAAETTEKVEEESMEVDATEETKTATEETENLVKNAPEKTETETKIEDTEMKEVEEEKKTKPEVVEATMEAETPAKEAEVEKMEEATTETALEDKKEEEAAQPVKDDEATKEEAKPIEEITVEEIEPSTPVQPEAVIEDLEPIVEEPEAQVEEEEKKDKEKEAQPVTEEIVVEELKEEEAETKVAEEEMVVEEAKEQNKDEPEKAEEEKVEEATTSEAKSAEEEGETSAPKAEEKENKSVLANGVENGNKDESEVDNTADETAEVTNDDNVDNKDDDNEVKVKKLEESAESKTVSVEV